MPYLDFDYLPLEDLSPTQVRQVLIGLLSHLKLEPIITREVCGTAVPTNHRSLQFMNEAREVVSDIYQPIKDVT